MWLHESIEIRFINMFIYRAEMSKSFGVEIITRFGFLIKNS